jgi:hypothetical protein
MSTTIPPFLCGLRTLHDGIKVQVLAYKFPQGQKYTAKDFKCERYINALKSIISAVELNASSSMALHTGAAVP